MLLRESTEALWSQRPDLHASKFDRNDARTISPQSCFLTKFDPNLGLGDL